MKIKSVVESALGVAIPAILFVLMIPVIIDNFGVERFGYISLFWVVLSVSSILDLGVSRALTNYVAKNRNNKIALQSVWSVIVILSLLCLGITTILVYSSSTLTQFYTDGSSVLQSELNIAIQQLCYAIPMVILYSVIKGTIEGSGDFRVTAIIKIVMSLIIVLPLVFVNEGDANLTYVADILIISRLTGLIVIFYIYIGRFKPNIINLKAPVYTIFKYGGFVAISTFCSAFLVYSDRFISSSLLDAYDFGVYSLHSDVIMRFLFIPGAISAVMFQDVSLAKSLNEVTKSIKKATILVVLTIVPIALVLSLFGGEIFNYWAKIDLSNSDFGSMILLFSLGLVFNSLAHIPFSYIQAAGSVKFTAKLHIFEFILFVPLMYFMCLHFGVYGILFTWLCRIIFDTVFLIVKAYNLYRFNLLNNSVVGHVN